MGLVYRSCWGIQWVPLGYLNPTLSSLLDLKQLQPAFTVYGAGKFDLRIASKRMQHITSSYRTSSLSPELSTLSLEIQLFTSLYIQVYIYIYICIYMYIHTHTHFITPPTPQT